VYHPTVDTVATNVASVIIPPVINPCSKNPILQPGRWPVDGKEARASRQAVADFVASEGSRILFTRAELFVSATNWGRGTWRRAGV
jgi:hypothetical protein